MVCVMTSLEVTVGFATDGASVMLGRKADVGKLMTDQYPNVLVWHCLAHRLELSVHDTMKEVSGTNNFKICIDKYCTPSIVCYQKKSSSALRMRNST